MPTTTHYIWDEDNLLAETDGSNLVQTVYTNEPQEYGNLVSSRLPISGTPATLYHHFDATGSTRQLTNATGAATDTAIYDAWGDVVDRTGTTPVGFLWIAEVGYYVDVETGQVNVRARVYRLLIARWASMDPNGYIDGTNRFIYVRNAPIDNVDPSGTALRATQGSISTLRNCEFHTCESVVCPKSRSNCYFEIKYRFFPGELAEVCVFHKVTPGNGTANSMSDCESDMERAPSSSIVVGTSVPGTTCKITPANFNPDGIPLGWGSWTQPCILLLREGLLTFDPPRGGQRLFGDRQGQCIRLTSNNVYSVDYLRFDIHQEIRCKCTVTGQVKTGVLDGGFNSDGE
jgi:RHS repeat-associated protein